MAIKSSTVSMQIGDKIPCRYTAIKASQIGYFSELGTCNLTPIPSNSTSPHGLFYFIHCGYDSKGRIKLIADRNIQGGISWDTLNTAGICSEINLDLLKNNLNNLLSSTTFPTAFDGVTTGGPNVTTNSNFDFSFTTPKKLISYDIYGYSNYSSYMPKAWTLKGSNDATTWLDISSESNIISWSTGYATFKVQNPDYYKYYRIVFTSTVGGGNTIYIYDINLNGYAENQLLSTAYSKVYMRLLTGGNSSTNVYNEWDKIIASSTLNNTITAGDRYVWNWAAGYSWVTTSGDISSLSSDQRLVRGIYSSTYFSYATSSVSSINNGFRPVLLVNQLAYPAMFEGNLLSSSIHTEDAILTGSIIDYNKQVYKVQYKILVNNVQIYPDSGYTEFMSYPLAINYNIANSLLTQTNNKITIITNNELNIITSNDFYATLYNNAPNGILTLSNTTTHNTNIELTGNITDTNLDKISYRILINDIEVLMWTIFTEDPYIDYTINASDLIIGSNKIAIEYKDNYKNSLMGSWTNNVIKTNSSSIINCQYINGSIIGTATDPDSDLVQYRILVNGIQKYPLNGFTEFDSVSNINYQINRNDILIGKDNIITIVAQDNLGTQISQDITFIGDYIGLMFMDEQKKYYSTDIGDLLKYLDFGTITLGTITEPIKILVQNKYGFKINNITLNVINSLPNINVEFSKEENPFIATDKLILEKEYAINEIDYFYIRLSTSISSNSVNGGFKITAKAIPI